MFFLLLLFVFVLYMFRLFICLCMCVPACLSSRKFSWPVHCVRQCTLFEFNTYGKDTFCWRSTRSSQAEERSSMLILRIRYAHFFWLHNQEIVWHTSFRERHRFLFATIAVYCASKRPNAFSHLRHRSFYSCYSDCCPCRAVRSSNVPTKYSCNC